MHRTQAWGTPRAAAVLVLFNYAVARVPHPFAFFAKGWEARTPAISVVHQTILPFSASNRL
ncbi:hypothetical protein SBA1_340045 [Candidatus Sulfotelmatobacter kueseliae]|uniref:Uncharacterized protein n=1 Tax=Candidatus Sulfotelmatobacter kueseliae TaxID=2042962 RepID=A0A2U3KMW4_9BACT|nr:hypothetical protein SBA1_340045 [Candidatus Sulfotelmatobacter kueseliae]